jgi:acetyl-CoA carboxylase biotin carboxyl carrier protein
MRVRRLEHMDLDDVKQILELVREHDLSEFELERDGLKIRVRKDGGRAVAGPDVAAAPPHALAAPAAAAAAHAHATPLATPSAAEAPAEAEVAEADDIQLAVVKSPIVGTFYRSSEPGTPPFVELGSAVKKGQVLCIIEAMKLMNEIESDHDGEVARIYVENGQAVQYGERLFAIRSA